MGPMGAAPGYGYHGAAPPPAYGHEDWVPAYEPPQGGTKVDPNQNSNSNVQGRPGGGGSSQVPVPVYPGGDLGSRRV